MSPLAIAGCLVLAFAAGFFACWVLLGARIMRC